MADTQKKRGPKTVSDSHKAAMAEGRNESRAVRLYLEAVAANKPKRGRKRTTESITKRLSAIEMELEASDMLSRVNLIQERMDLNDELANMGEAVDLSELEAGFVSAAKGYSQRKGISYAAWREAGVEPALLQKAGISRGA